MRQMKNPLKKITAAALALVWMLALAVSASASLLPPSEDYYVADYAGVLMDATKETIIGANGALETLTGGQIVVVTVQYLDGFSSDEYAVQLFNDWGVGDYSRNNGMLLLLATGENKAWLTQGAGIEDDFDGDAINALMDQVFWDKFDAGDYDGAVGAIFPQLVAWYEGFYGVSVLNVGGAQEPARSGFERFAVVFSVIVFVVILLVVIVLAALWADKRRYRRYYYGMGAPMPVYRPYFLFFGGPHRPRHHHPPMYGGRDHRPPGGFGGSGFGGGGFSSGEGGGRGGFSGGGRGSGGGGRSSGGGGGRR